jgi:hypothetical protein
MEGGRDPQSWLIHYSPRRLHRLDSPSVLNAIAAMMFSESKNRVKRPGTTIYMHRTPRRLLNMLPMINVDADMELDKRAKLPPQVDHKCRRYDQDE